MKANLLKSGKIAALAGLLGLYVAGSVNVHATLTIQSSDPWGSQPVPAGGTTGWLTAVINDVAGGVQITLTTANINTIKIDRINFNSTLFNSLATGANPGVSLGAHDASLDTASFGANSFQPDGDGQTDIQLDFFTSNANKFGQNQTVNVTLLGTGLTAASFNALSQPPSGGGGAGHLIGVHFLSIDSLAGGSTWSGGEIRPPGSSVPEPSTIIAGAMLLIPFGMSTIRILRKKS